MKTNMELQTDVQNAIRWEPFLNSSEIGVTAKDGVVSLTGTVDSYFKKVQTEDTAKKVIGVKAIVENIEIEFPTNGIITDAQVAKDVLNALEANYSLPHSKIAVKVEKGWVTLGGECTWNYQKEGAKNAIHHIKGVRGVSNNIKIKESQEEIEKHLVEKAIARNWSIDDSKIKVMVNGSTVTLSGTVSSWHEKDEAGRIAWNTPGIWHLKNDLEVDYYFSFG